MSNVNGRWVIVKPSPITLPVRTINVNGQAMPIHTGDYTIIRGNIQNMNVPHMVKVNGRWVNQRIVPDSTVVHASLGEFQANGRMRSGGHGQSNIDHLTAEGVEFNIVRTFPNGVMVGNVPNHKNPNKQSGIGQSWFPQSWNDATIREAGLYVKSLHPNLPDGQFAFGNFRGVRVGIIKQDGIVRTIFPDNSTQP